MNVGFSSRISPISQSSSLFFFKIRDWNFVQSRSSLFFFRKKGFYMPLLPFLKAAAAKRIPMNRIRTNPQCILGSSIRKVQLRGEKKSATLKSRPTVSLALDFVFFFHPSFHFFTKAEVSPDAFQTISSYSLSEPVTAALSSPAPTLPLLLSKKNETRENNKNGADEKK